MPQTLRDTDIRKAIKVQLPSNEAQDLLERKTIQNFFSSFELACGDLV